MLTDLSEGKCLVKMTTQREQSEDGVLEIHADETSRRALLLADVPDDELEEAVEDIKARKRRKYLPALQSVLCNYKQSTRFLYSIIKDGHQPEEIDHRDNVSDFVLALFANVTSLLVFVSSFVSYICTENRVSVSVTAINYF